MNTRRSLEDAHPQRIREKIDFSKDIPAHKEQGQAFRSV